MVLGIDHSNPYIHSTTVLSVAILGGFLRFPETSQNWAGARARASS